MLVPFGTSYTSDGVNMLSYPETYRVGFEWREVGSFTAIMQVSGMERGRSAARFILTDTQTGIDYPMFMTDMLDLIKRRHLMEGRVVGNWEPKKRGSNYGVKLSA